MQFLSCLAYPLPRGGKSIPPLFFRTSIEGSVSTFSMIIERSGQYSKDATAITGYREGYTNYINGTISKRSKMSETENDLFSLFILPFLRRRLRVAVHRRRSTLCCSSRTWDFHDHVDAFNVCFSLSYYTDMLMCARPLWLRNRQASIRKTWEEIN